MYQIHRRGTVSTLFYLFFAISISACSDSNSDEDDTDIAAAPDASINELSTDALKRSASANIGGALNAPIDGAVEITDNEPQPADNLLWDDDNQSLIDQTLQLGNENNTTRTGTRITIDPDETDLCIENAVDMADDQPERERCETLLRDLLVQLDVSTETSGTLTYLYQTRPLMAIDYSSNSNSFELDLGTMQTLINDNENLDDTVITDFEEGSEDDTVTASEGAIKLSADIINPIIGEESSVARLEVSQPVLFESGTATLSIAQGKLIEVATDEAAGTARIELAVGQIVASQTEDNKVRREQLNGLTAIINGSENNDQLVVSNLGIGSGPLIVSIDAVEALNLGLDTFGFTISETQDGESITLDGALNLRQVVNEITEDGSVSSTIGTIFNLTVPAGTVFLDKLNGSTELSAGGPLISSVSGTDTDGSQISELLEVTVGQCFTDVGSDEYSAGTIVDCDQPIDQSTSSTD